MLIFLLISIALNCFLLGWGREAVKEARRYKEAMSESDKTVAVLEQMKADGWDTSFFGVQNGSHRDVWLCYSYHKDGRETETIWAKALTEAVSKLQKATNTTVNYEVTMK